MASFLTDRLEPVFYSNSPGQSPPPSPFPQTPVGRQDPLSAASSRSFTPTQPLCHHLLLNLHDNSNRRPLNPLEPALPLLLCVKILCQALLLMSPLLVAILSMAPSLCLSQKQARDHDHPHFLSRRLCRTSLLLPPSAPFDPLRSDSYPISLPPADAVNRAVSQQLPRPQETDPLGNIRPHQMSASMRVQPTRPRLDPREAASKLANMF